MASGNFDRCLAFTLAWEGGYSNDAEDPGGATMKGITHAEYDRWRVRRGQRARSVKLITDDEVRAIYRASYWDAMACDTLDAGYDLCVFDAAVNSGVGRARTWMEAAPSIDAFQAARLAFLRQLRTWRVFGKGWGERVAGIRVQAHGLAGNSIAAEPSDASLHAGMTGDAVTRLQTKLRALGYPAGEIDGIFGEQTYRAVVLFQTDTDAIAEHDGVWRTVYDAELAKAAPMLPARRTVTHKDLEAAGDKPVRRMNLLQRIFAWLFGASAVAQVYDADSVSGSLTAVQGMLDPVRGVAAWVSGNRWLLAAMGCAAAVAIVRSLRNAHVDAFRYFDYQGPFEPRSGSLEAAGAQKKGSVDGKLA